jgi:hypothetical protein
MKEVKRAIREAYFTALEGIKLDGYTFPLHDGKAPLDSMTHFIILTDQANNPVALKGAFLHESSIAVDITTNFPLGKGGMELSERAADEVLLRIKPMDGHIAISEPFRIITTKSSAPEGIDDDLQTRRCCRQRIVFTHKVAQLTND